MARDTAVPPLRLLSGSTGRVGRPVVPPDDEDHRLEADVLRSEMAAEARRLRMVLHSSIWGTDLFAPVAKPVREVAERLERRSRDPERAA